MKQAKIASILLISMTSFSVGMTLYTLIKHHFFPDLSIENLPFFLSWALSISILISAICFLSGSYKFVRWLLVSSLANFFIVMSFFILHMLLREDMGNRSVSSYYYFIQIANFLIIGFSCISFKKFLRVKADQASIDGEIIQGAAIMPKAGTRLLNRIIDTALLMFVLFNLPFISIRRSDNEGIYVLYYLLNFIFYLLLEASFKTTPGKVLTGCTIIDANGEKPSFIPILIRTFCRFIPFDAFSYFGKGRGWHDTLPNLYIVKDEIFIPNNSTPADD